MLPDFISTIRRFLQGDWLNASMAVKFWAYAKPTADEIMAAKLELDAAPMGAMHDVLLIKGILLYCRLDASSLKPEDFTEAVSCFSRAASHRVFAWQMLGLLYERGEINELDFSKLVSGCEKVLQNRNSSQSERALAANNLGHWYLCGFGVMTDYYLAKKYYAQAAGLGETEAVFQIGLLYEHEAEVTGDYAMAKRYYEQAARSHYARALDKLGTIYEQGIDVPRNWLLAAQYYKQAAELGEVLALNHLGFLYENGWGVPENFPAAEECYGKAIALGDPHAAMRLVELYVGVSVWYGSFSVVRLETFAKNILKRREVNYLAARILGGNFVDVCPEINCLLANNTPNPALRILLQLLQILNYLVQRRGKGDDLDYQIRLNDFSAITQKAAQSKYATQQYLAQHPFAKKFLHSNHYFHLRSGLSEVLAVTTDNDFFQALQLYRLYLKFRKLRATTRAEQEIAHKL